MFVVKKQESWRKKLGSDLNWALSFDHLREADTTKHVHASGKDLGAFISGLFPAPIARAKKGKEDSQSGDGSRIDTYEGSSEGGDTDEIE